MASKLGVALSGGGSKGAFQVGALAELRDLGIPLSAFAGVSTGAIQALGGAMDDIDGLMEYWLSIRSNADIFLPSRLNPAGLNETSPLRRKLDAFFDPAKLRASGKELRVGVVSLQSGAFRTVDQHNTKLPAWIQASCAVPIEFLPIAIEGLSDVVTQWVDGGVRHVTPIALARGLDVDGVIALRASPAPQVEPVSGKLRDVMAIGLRAAEILQAEVSANDLAEIDINNDIAAARAQVEVVLVGLGLPRPAIEQALLPLDTVRVAHDIKPVFPIVPDRFYSKPHEFEPESIRVAIDAGREKVRQLEPEIGAFLARLPTRDTKR